MLLSLSGFQFPSLSDGFGPYPWVRNGFLGTVLDEKLDRAWGNPLQTFSSGESLYGMDLDFWIVRFGF